MKSLWTIAAIIGGIAIGIGATLLWIAYLVADAINH